MTEYEYPGITQTAYEDISEWENTLKELQDPWRTNMVNPELYHQSVKEMLGE